MISEDLKQAFLTLVRLGIGHTVSFMSDDINWKEMKALADKHGLSAIVLDGINEARNLPLDVRCELPDKSLLTRWIGEVLQSYEQRYVRYEKAIGDLAKFYNEHGFKMMVLKGYGLSLNYPNPAHRPCGDIDTWQFGEQKEADEALRQAQGPDFEIDASHHHHTVFYWQNFMVENHYDFLNVHYGHRNDEIEKLLKEQGKDDIHSVEVNGQTVYLPSANLHALFILRHALANFASTGMNLRQVLDWAFFIEKHGKEVDWDWLMPIFKEYHIMDFMKCINAISVEDLGFSSGIFPIVQFKPEMKERVLSDILSPEFSGKTPRGFLKRAIFKYRRWQANAWKQELCYGDSRTKAFIQGVWSHLLKPASI